LSLLCRNLPRHVDPICPAMKCTSQQGETCVVYRRTGNLRAVQLLLGHTKIESTVRYLGIEVDDALGPADPRCVIVPLDHHAVSKIRSFHGHAKHKPQCTWFGKQTSRLASHLQAVYSSQSWRLTRPLRALKDVLDKWLQ